jgi:hypothetical protein
MSSESVAVADLDASHIHRYICISQDSLPDVNAGLVAGLIVGVQNGRDGKAVTIAVGKGRTVTVTASPGRAVVGDDLIDVLHKSVAVDGHRATRSVGKRPAVQAQRRMGRHLRAVPGTGIRERKMVDFTA